MQRQLFWAISCSCLNMETPTTATQENVKIAQTQNPVHPLIKERWSARSFSAATISQTELDTILEAASWSPSSMNEQPWVYIYANRGSAVFAGIWDTLMAGNQPWAQNASVLIASLARKTHANNGAFNKYAWYDTGAANQSLLLQAASMGILGHIMGGFNKAQAEELLQLPEDLELVCFIALGYPAPAEALEEPFRTRETTPRSRKPVNAFAFADKLK